ncbi:MAG: RecX family transcriptional regulator [Marinilabiliales bacterium]|nr:MAG: RecX family transcriptional regulator [Marinilabiliales bacterium]
MSTKKVINHSEALDKIRKFCAAEEKCRYDVRKKLFDWGVSSGDTEKIINSLVEDKFVDEWRFARLFAGSKFRNNKWGRIKISYELTRKNIARNIIEDALIRIDETEYLDMLTKELRKKQRSVSAGDEWTLRAKLHRYASSKGYENEIINKVLDDMITTTEA